MSQQSCFEVITGLDDVAKELLSADQRYYVLGGIASAAIAHPESVFDFQTNTLIAAADCSEPNIRANGTLRDIDVLVLDKMPKEKATQVRDDLSEAINGRLEVSVFGLAPHPEPTPLTRVKAAFDTWTSKRTVDGNGRFYYELFPLVQEVPEQSYLPWRLELPQGSTVTILNPAAHVLAYRMRSISGIRTKDLKKVATMTQVIESVPAFKEQIEDGDLRTWSRFADNIEDLVWGSLRRTMGISPQVSQAEVNWLRRKGHILHFLESNPTIVKLAQSGVLQRALKPFVGAA